MVLLAFHDVHNCSAHLNATDHSKPLLLDDFLSIMLEKLTTRKNPGSIIFEPALKAIQVSLRIERQEDAIQKPEIVPDWTKQFSRLPAFSF